MSGATGAGPVRPYVITGGRVAPSRDTLALETLVVAAGSTGAESTGATEATTATGAAAAAGEHAADLSPECAAILDLCVRLLSVAEVAAHLRQPVAVIKVLLADLLDAGLVVARPPVTAADRHDPALLKEVLDGLRQL
ncbi:DUF742 domain-containing protein [Streptomyces mobaraensis NBRC 13819 = DSM 40847]|uniref:DUF742 domain-containing protein n=1 Tax=Streptomyces mobaraensis TaxID=35621 RepID=A0A5N5W3K0_STRMB|nr:DUF742 domain-containing protein [Streptomyces mobaraensis]KAB7837976.1 DUF742 domain-containing protein [Streptomyces mobaraensis]QTT74257.1 DUF742 domain-containing protein [Streptomyces mobaraensis NBRC 13819 = DSM 40847]